MTGNPAPRTAASAPRRFLCPDLSSAADKEPPPRARPPSRPSLPAGRAPARAAPPPPRSPLPATAGPRVGRAAPRPPAGRPPAGPGPARSPWRGPLAPQQPRGPGSASPVRPPRTVGTHEPRSAAGGAPQAPPRTGAGIFGVANRRPRWDGGAGRAGAESRALGAGAGGTAGGARGAAGPGRVPVGNVGSGRRLRRPCLGQPDPPSPGSRLPSSRPRTHGETAALGR